MPRRSLPTLLSAAILFVFLSLPAAAAEWGTIRIPSGSPVKIGMGTMLTGDYAGMGIDIMHGAEMAVKEKGLILGHPVILQVEDDGCAGPPSVVIAEKFCNDPLIAGVVGYMCSGGSKPASDIHNKYKMVMISPSSTALELTSRKIPIFFRTCWNDRIQAQRAADFAASRGWLRAAVLHDKSDYGQSLAEDFAQHLETRGGEVLAMEGVTRGDKDFSPVLTKIKPLRPQLVYFGGMSAEGVLVVRQMQRVGIRAKFLSDDGCFTEKDFIQAGGRAATGSFVTYAQEPDPAWVAHFESMYGPRQTFSPQAYDAATILLMAVESAAERQPDDSLLIDKRRLRDALAATDHEGVTGRIVFDTNGDRTGSVVAVYEVVEEGGKRFFRKVPF
ncbi:branched-chain amino acid ABC transporter substrate-binding protein [Desulfatiglans anilini]|uniref:branched-chain amino acid ABC transporter substrate-binding protein n=1 Tax=Desulfatiglans anilini TaxID=90728 RepID=UPI00040CFD6D|nr:branched-chain amino acid ABC transporter substrate-binding protein [Desulfatiglans anilini]